jgi:ubiquitin C-terminal hydrolase
MVGGFPNYGATCWLNSLTQSLLNQPSIMAEVLNNHDNEACRALISAQNGDISSMVKLFRSANFGRGQEDAHEGLVRLADKLPEIVVKKFMIYWNCRVVKVEDPSAPFQQIGETVIDKSISTELSMINGPLPQLLQEETHMETKSTYRIYRMRWAPEVIIILARNRHTRMQSNPQMKFSLPSIDSTMEYKLTAVIEHRGNIISGTASSGHYIAYILVNDEWYCCDDSKVTVCPSITPLIKNGYLYFYHIIV